MMMIIVIRCMAMVAIMGHTMEGILDIMMVGSLSNVIPITKTITITFLTTITIILVITAMVNMTHIITAIAITIITTIIVTIVTKVVTHTTVTPGTEHQHLLSAMASGFLKSLNDLFHLF